MKVVIGIDECGTGAWAGPIVVACVAVPHDWRPSPLVRDSKAFSGTDAHRRTEVRQRVLDRHVTPFAQHVAVQSASALDVATEGHAACWQRMVQTLIDQARALDFEVHRLVVDGAYHPAITGAEFVVGADRSIPAVSAASMAAKAHRDQQMLTIERKHPGYGFASHQGYGTAAHRAELGRRGACAEHRLSIAAVRDLDRLAKLDPVAS